MVYNSVHRLRELNRPAADRQGIEKIKKSTIMTVSLDWENLGFSYMKLPYRYLAHFAMG